MSADNNRRIENIIRFGTIAKVDYAAAKVRVKCGQILTDFLPWLTPRAGTTQIWSPPTINEQCVILSASGELTTAVVLVGIFTQNAPSQDENEHVITFADGATVGYNQQSRALQISGMKSAEISIPKITINGDIQLNGSLTSTGDQIAGGISTMTHKHPGDSGGTTGQPQ